jgi:hypothetical protein
MPGSLPSVEGRRGISVKLSNQFLTPGGSPNTLVGNAAQTAINEWNGTTENGQPNGTKIGYFLQVKQSVSNPDIIIQLVPHGSLNFGKSDAGSGPLMEADGKTQVPGKRVIKLDPIVLSYPPARLAALIAHEIGHLLGLVDRYDPGCNTIVTQVTPTNIPFIHGTDVARVNQHLGSRNDCQVERPVPWSNEPGPTPTPTPSSNCPDSDGDSICDAQDCNDNAAWASFDLDGDGFCEDVDCADMNALAYPGAPLDPETNGGEDRNCNGQDDYDEQGLGRCGWLNEMRCRAAGKDWEPGLCTCTFYTDPSPILIDVLGDGFRLTSNEGGVNFDLNNDGIKERLSWTAPSADDAWLMLDRNGNGVADNGSELFGNFTAQPSPPYGEARNGFLALAEFDKIVNGGNADGEISKQDAIFRSLRLWQDFNHNGISEVSELKSLRVAGLKKLQLDYKQSKRTDEFGNQFRYRAKVKDTNDAQLGRWAWDVYLLR